MGLTQVNSGGIEDGSIVNADIKSDSAIALSKLASTPAVLTGSTNNTITTVTGANAIQGEANLTFDGTKLILGNSGTGNGSSAVQSFIAHGSTAGESGLRSIDTTAVAAGVGGEVSFAGKYNTGAQDYAYTGHIRGIKENATAGDTACALTFHTRPTATAPQERLRIESGGNVKIVDGDLVIGTSGHGIDFSATSDASGMTSETLDSYEEGTWTPTMSANVTLAYGTYTKVGRMVNIWLYMQIASNSTSSNVVIGGMPFTPWNTVPNLSGNIVVSNGGSGFFIFADNASTNLYVRDFGNTAIPMSDLSGKFFYATAAYQVA